MDRVPSWSVVSKIEVISKLNNLKEGIKSGDRICINCNVKARRKEKNVEKNVEIHNNLDAATQNRESWLKHNSSIAKELLECSDDQLISS